MKQQTNRFWGLLIGLIALLALLGVFLLPLLQKEGDVVQILQNGSDIPSHTLPLDQDQSLRIPSEGGGYNTVVIEGGKVRVTEASCPDQVCVRHAPTDRTADDIVCLPHKLVVRVVHATPSSTDLDGVAG